MYKLGIATVLFFILARKTTNVSKRDGLILSVYFAASIFVFSRYLHVVTKAPKGTSMVYSMSESLHS